MRINRLLLLGLALLLSSWLFVGFQKVSTVSACSWVTTSCGSGCADNQNLYNCSSDVQITSVTPDNSNPDSNAKAAAVAPPAVNQAISPQPKTNDDRKPSSKPKLVKTKAASNSSNNCASTVGWVTSSLILQCDYGGDGTVDYANGTSTTTGSQATARCTDLCNGISSGQQPSDWQCTPGQIECVPDSIQGRSCDEFGKWKTYANMTSCGAKALDSCATAKDQCQTFIPDNCKKTPSYPSIEDCKNAFANASFGNNDDDNNPNRQCYAAADGCSTYSITNCYKKPNYVFKRDCVAAFSEAFSGDPINDDNSAVLCYHPDRQCRAESKQGVCPADYFTSREDCSPANNGINPNQTTCSSPKDNVKKIAIHELTECTDPDGCYCPDGATIASCGNSCARQTINDTLDDDRPDDDFQPSYVRCSDFNNDEDQCESFNACTYSQSRAICASKQSTTEQDEVNPNSTDLCSVTGDSTRTALSYPKANCLDPDGCTCIGSYSSVLIECEESCPNLDDGLSSPVSDQNQSDINLCSGNNPKGTCPPGESCQFAFLGWTADGFPETTFRCSSGPSINDYLNDQAQAEEDVSDLPQCNDYSGISFSPTGPIGSIPCQFNGERHYVCPSGYPPLEAGVCPTASEVVQWQLDNDVVSETEACTYLPVGSECDNFAGCTTYGDKCEATRTSVVQNLSSVARDIACILPLSFCSDDQQQQAQQNVNNYLNTLPDCQSLPNRPESNYLIGSSTCRDTDQSGTIFPGYYCPEGTSRDGNRCSPNDDLGAQVLPGNANQDNQQNDTQSAQQDAQTGTLRPIALHDRKSAVRCPENKDCLCKYNDQSLVIDAGTTCRANLFDNIAPPQNQSSGLIRNVINAISQTTSKFVGLILNAPPPTITTPVPTDPIPNQQQQTQDQNALPTNQTVSITCYLPNLSTQDCDSVRIDVPSNQADSNYCHTTNMGGRFNDSELELCRNSARAGLDSYSSFQNRGNDFGQVSANVTPSCPNYEKQSALDPIIPQINPGETCQYGACNCGTMSNPIIVTCQHTCELNQEICWSPDCNQSGSDICSWPDFRTEAECRAARSNPVQMGISN